ncbi:MFS transporter [Mangrovibacter plantisponsor]|uniref:Sugar phosphate permease n=1 Tax=Mangrovibacter plantisponsor TaxID=451513 RepID=A0A317Q1B3_9ENTR|nr:MFS transporter [Mangrovibacter plantisponsor]PWW09141.1 sugar phosphate permease [Mangrovibacter plantisponsor]
MKNRYLPTALGLYLNYLVHGMGVILISLNMPHLEQQWQTDAAGVSIVISSLGIGRLVVLFLSGMLSDRFGRKPFIYLGMACYLLFFFGILKSQTIAVAYAFGFLAGIANSFLDSGTYPALMESFPNSPSTANILIKAFVSAGQFLLPFIISLLVWSNAWFGWSFVVAACIMILNAIFLLKRPFPDQDQKKAGKANNPASGASNQVAAAPRMSRSEILDIACFTLYGYISMATFYLVSQWLSQYGQFVAGMEYASAIKLLSLYTVGSLSCVFITAALVKKTVSSHTLLMLYTFISFIALLSVCLWPTPMMVAGFAFVIGFSAAGGVMQLALTIMAMKFPQAKGKATGIFYSAGSLATFTIPLITAELSHTSIASIMWFDTGLAAAGFALALIIGVRQFAGAHFAVKSAQV